MSMTPHTSLHKSNCPAPALLGGRHRQPCSLPSLLPVRAERPTSELCPTALVHQLRQSNPLFKCEWGCLARIDSIVGRGVKERQLRGPH